MNQASPQIEEDKKDLGVHVEGPTLDRHNDLDVDQKPTEFSASQLKSELDSLPLLKAVSTFKRVFFICLIAGFTASTDGYQNQVSGSILGNTGFINHISNGQYISKGAWALDPNWVSVFNGIFSAGQVFGQFGAQYISEAIGRRWAMMVITTILLIAVIIECITPAGSWGVWALSKVICGMGIGSVQATLPVFINEHAPVQMRGFLIVAYSLWFSLGGLMATIVLKVRNDSAPYDWRTTIFTQFAMIGISYIIYWFLPESPQWSIRHGKVDQARKTLSYTYKGVEGFNLEREINILLYTVEVQKQHDAEAKLVGPFAIFKGLNAKRFFIGAWPKVLQQFVGLAIFSTNAVYFFQIAAGNAQPFNVNLIIGCVSLGAVILDALLIDKIGRRPMTIIGFTGACTGVLLIAIVSLLDYANSPQLGAVLVFGGVMASFFNTFQSSTSYAYLTEMHEQRFKARGCGWGLAFCNLFAVLINFTLPLMIKVWSARTAWFFVCLGIPGTILAFFIMPESKGRSPAEIQEMFVDGVPLRRWRGYKTAVERDMETRMQYGL